MSNTHTEAPRPRTKTDHVAAQIRDQITSGQLPPATPLPSEAQMLDTYGVSRVTVRNAIAALKAEGLVTVIKGKGAFVRPAGLRPTHTDKRTITLENKGIYADTDTDPDTGNWQQVEAPSNYRTNANPPLALALGLAEHSPVFGTDRLLQDRAGRRILHRTYLPFATEAPDLEDHPFTTGGQLYTALAAAGHELRWTDYITARMPTPDDAATLHIPNGTPLLTTRRTITTPKGRPLAMEETHRSAEHTQLAYPVPTAPHSDAQR